MHKLSCTKWFRHSNSSPQVATRFAAPILAGNLSRSPISTAVAAQASLQTGYGRFQTRSLCNLFSTAWRAPSATAEALYGSEECENLVFSIQTQELGVQKRISEETARNELKAMERDARYAISHQNLQSQLAVRECQRRARDAVDQESSDNYESMVEQGVQMIQNQHERRLKENESKVAQVIGSEALEALRGQRNHMPQEHQALLQVGERRK